ncbi:MAG: 2-hydroxyacid dehydrogenase [Kineosporiaceae bacterium]|nr:2-hydroxyacid dehydrogenase [Kineosporiaceae bacterium]
MVVVPSSRPLVSVPDARWLGLWPDGESPVELSLWDMTAPLPRGGASAGRDPERLAFVVLPYMGKASVMHHLADLPSLQVVQLLSAGYESVLPLLPPGVTLTNAAGVHDSSTAELAVALAVSALRGIGEFARAQSRGRWLGGTRPALADRRVLLIGVGNVGEAIEARLLPFEVEVTRVGSRARDDGRGHVHGIDEVARLLPDHQVVVLACPLTEATRGLVDAAFLAAMPDGALLVNVARGPVVVTDDLVSALAGGRLHAALDVTDPEPLPAGHPLWRSPNTLISPHVGGDSTAFPPRARAMLRDQLERFAAGQPLVNIVAGPVR